MIRIQDFWDKKKKKIIHNRYTITGIDRILLKNVIRKDSQDFSEIISAFIHLHIPAFLCSFIQHIIIEYLGCSRPSVP